VINRQSGEGVWEEEESQALRQARKDAEFTTSADSVRVYLKQIARSRCSTLRTRCGSPRRSRPGSTPLSG
jgi:hypothetical protein